MKAESTDILEDARFEALLADVIREEPAMEPSADFASMVMAALPEEAPVVVPELEPGLSLSPWKWFAGGLAAAVAAVGSIWYWGGSILLWLYGVETERVVHMSEISFDLMLFVENLKATVASADIPMVTVAFLALLGVTAWGATAMASGSRAHV